MKQLLTTCLCVFVLFGAAYADDVIDAPFFDLELQLVGMDFVGVVPEGMRFDGRTLGVVSDGMLSGAEVTAIDYLLFRHDGVGVVDVRGLAVHEDGTTAAMTFKGFLGEPTPGLLEAMLDPAYAYEDVDMPVHGALWLQTMAPQYAFANHTVFGCVGAVNPAQGWVRYTCRALAH